ncbi:hypothetical protein DFO66_103403 [Brevibacterium sanguinis]|uniref:Uncharacterized protein n=2 Tax=Brevibacterium TaxID=1696 RepID=A0A366INE4_9MICO|nr:MULTISPECIES: hypothetical protein [Brevibacterium]RBP66453.1 hypothetical protein DFO66_103403 [Brevibacterium sanguinis]RBP73105.1 hypothetical protein DFO65_103403 [Brevibacterium celere]
MRLIGIGMKIHVDGDARAQLREQFDAVMEELLFLEARDKIIMDPAVSVDLAAGDMEIEVAVHAETAEEGERIARREIERALEDAGKQSSHMHYVNSGNHSELLEPA